ncbi:FtsX-like permease family protein [Pedobacter sp. HMF7647]|uniref:FtsX-like permease family protein n=1 Tax=Hufsiella arboris TaxID=2695275 RepID=A0A7K1YA45_9SPHI|nr:ABC transporter permease [Hufsiella arboris]MXV51457.1 FtsX-like permease family protein [Hufsiella arboris]
MIRNYLKIAWRNLLRNKGFSLINIAGLAIGMASAILILLWIQNEISYDQFHTKKDRLYVMYNRSVFDGKLWCWQSTPKIMGPTMKMSYSQVEETSRINQATFLFTVGEKHLTVRGAFTDPGFLTMFSFPLINGDSKTALKNTQTVVITEKLSKKLFGNDNAMGKTVKIDSNAYFTVTGVMKDQPNNTRFQDFEYFMPWSYMKKIGWDENNWGNNSVQTYVLLKPGVTETAANKAFLNITRTHSDIKDIDQFVHPISKWRLYSKFENGKITGGRIEIVRLFSVIAIFILLIACINFMNLSTARSEKRAREVGIRKVVGAQKGSLVGQFLGESIIISLISGIIALVVVQLSLKGFNALTDKELFIPYSSLFFWLISLGFVLFTGIVAGSYPAFYLSSYRPVKVLKGTFKAAHALVTPRKVLVILQFTFAIALIICTIIIQRQINHAQQRDLGYNKNNLAYVFMTGEVEKHYTAIKNEMLASNAVTAVTKTSAPMTEGWSDSWDYSWKGKNTTEKLDFDIYNTDGDFVKTMGLKLVTGRDIDLKAFPSDSTAMILNEAAVKTMGFKNAIGQIVKGQGRDWHVVGVIKDFILSSPYEPVKQMVIQGPSGWFNVIHFKLNDNASTENNLKKIEAVFKKYNPDYPFEYNFIDEAYSKKFRDEQRIGTLAALFAGLTIVISCLGLFALAAYMAENRIKEIGVRKVLGASVSGLAVLLSKDFLKLVLISFAIASPIAWWAMHKWLQDYTYRVSISWWIFAITGIISMAIAVATVSFQALRAARANPVKNLRTE